MPSEPIKFDPTKPVRTRKGDPAEILCADFCSESGRTIIARMRRNGGEHQIFTAYPDGKIEAVGDNLWDLINVPPPEQCVEVWLNIYADGIAPVAHSSKAAARFNRQEYWVACVPVVVRYREGDGR